MDQIVIGRFIASERKRKGYTQRQLADAIGISDKTISKWERGNGFPEVSLLLPLCDELDITVNELLSGERFSEEEYQKKAEENMVNMIREREENKRKAIQTLVTGVIATVAFVTINMVVAYYSHLMSTPVIVLLEIIAIAIFISGILVAMKGERTLGYYQCKNCEELFVPSFGAYSMGMHLGTTRHLRCPHCGQKTWCKKVFSQEK